MPGRQAVGEGLRFGGPEDAAFALGFTPYASATINLMRQAAARHMPQVVVTDSPFSPLVPESGVRFEIAGADVEGFRSLAATLTLAMALTVAVANLRRNREKQNPHADGNEVGEHVSHDATPGPSLRRSRRRGLGPTVRAARWTWAPSSGAKAGAAGPWIGWIVRFPGRATEALEGRSGFQGHREGPGGGSPRSAAPATRTAS
ncbi:MurR/RpiR family transcriptional regulator [Pleomorphomonas koreensis]|uniref:MurR/RpiR family transcriptional regulator n=1 Tax=Pleomorphomonas koreensis TaxID=257440 RepID=UPI00040CF56B|nr:SIS domain-containing protein [Pleomorphomonas koreensis]